MSEVRRCDYADQGCPAYVIRIPDRQNAYHTLEHPPVPPDPDAPEWDQWILTPLVIGGRQILTREQRPKIVARPFAHVGRERAGQVQHVLRVHRCEALERLRELAFREPSN